MHNKYKDTTYGHIGISVNSDSLEATKEVSSMPKYGLFPLKQLSKVNSFIVVDEIFYIGKISPSGKEVVTYNVYRTSDMRHIASSAHSKEETIKLVKRKYFALVT